MSEESNWNTKKIIYGLGIERSSNSKPSDYISECKIKKAIRNISSETLLKFHYLRRPSTDFNSQKGLRREEIIFMVQQLNSERLNKAFSIMNELGIEDALYFILKIKKKDESIRKV